MRGRAQSDDYRVDGREEQQSGGLGVLEIRVDVPDVFCYCFRFYFNLIKLTDNIADLTLMRSARVLGFSYT